MATLYDDWSGYTLDTVPTGYTRRNAGGSGTITVRELVGDTSDRALRILGIGGTTDYLTPDSISSATTDQQALVVGRRLSGQTLGAWDLNAYVRFDATALNGYMVGVYNGTNIRLVHWANGTFNVLDDAAFTYAAGERVALRLEASGTTVRAKAWKYDTDAEPGTWIVSQTDSGVSAGKPGVGRMQGSLAGETGTFVDFWSAGTGTDAAPLSGTAETPLDTPTGFTFVADGSARQIVGAWNSVTNADTYDWQVEYEVSPATVEDPAVWATLDSGSTATLTFTVTDTDGVDWNTKHRGRVRAVPAA